MFIYIFFVFSIKRECVLLCIFRSGFRDLVQVTVNIICEMHPRFRGDKETLWENLRRKMVNRLIDRKYKEMKMKHLFQLDDKDYHTIQFGKHHERAILLLSRNQDLNADIRGFSSRSLFDVFSEAHLEKKEIDYTCVDVVVRVVNRERDLHNT